jgi:hypothetical protein
MHTTTLAVSWNKCQGDNWCGLNTVNLDHSHFDGMEGVYVIWHGGSKARTVRVGQGIIRDRLQAHRNDPEVQAYANKTLYVTWASVAKAKRDGVERFLADQLNPLVGIYPNAHPIPVNLPW